MNYQISTEENATILSIAGELDAITVVDLRHSLDRLAQNGPQRIVVDLAGLRLIDSCGVGAIVSLFRRARSQGRHVTIRGAQDQPLAILKLLKLDQVLIGNH